tara:strand:- start:569 stop:727 length:159 start_codon:yes stop_codon:yes gene_type:complete
MLVKVFLTLDIDEDDYQMPADESLDEEVRDALQEYIYDIDGMSIKTIKIITE